MRLLSALLASTLALGAQAAEWVQLLPAGEFAARDGRPGAGRTWRVDDTLGTQLAARFNATAARTPVVIDYDHQTLYVREHGRKAPAAGWMDAAEWRAGQGLFAKVQWTPAAAQHIQEREYLYISPVLLYDADTLQVHGVALAALVNFPALLGMEPVLAQLATQFDHQETDPMNPTLAALIALLGLPADTAETAALDAVRALKDRPLVSPALAGALKLQPGADEAAALAAVTALARPDTSAASAMAALQGQLAELTRQINEGKLEKLVADALAAGKLVPAQKDWAMDLGRKDLAALQAFVAAAPVVPLAGQSGGKPPGGDGTAADPLAAQVMQQFGLNAETFAKGKPATAAA